ncbi:MAG: hypothetical protein KGR19_10150 [Acidobacteria bacterium]|nr:hypothetical protein [Acidobacteriota bacterium]
MRRRWQELSRLEGPPGFVLWQFPNPPLILALLGLVAGWLTTGTVHSVARALFVVGFAVFAWLELFDGVNWFRRLIGAGALAYLVVMLTGQLG